MEAIKISGLTKFYGKSRGVIDLNLTVREGDFFGFIGPNGSGKSTTIRTLLGLIKPTSGEAFIFNNDITSNNQEILKSVGYLPSEAIFYSGMKVKDILNLSAKIRKMDCTEEAHSLCNRLQLDTNKKVDELSFGNRKKVGIVCALQHNPKLLILDEPTSGLDPLMQKEFFSILKDRNKAGTTIFLSSHILSEIEHNCNRAAIIKNGKLLVCDSIDNLSKTSAKHVTIHGNYDPTGLLQTRNIKKQDDSVSFLYTGDINELIKELSSTNINDLTITEPDLEEVFMHYYADGGEQK